MKSVKYLCVLILFNTACMTKKVEQSTFIFDMQGHRGCRGLMPENTVAAMLKAIDLGVTTLELDVVITADQKVILSHEPFFNHEISTAPNGTVITEANEKSFNIYTLNYGSILKYDVGLKKHPRFLQQEKMAASKPLLSQVFTAVKAHCKMTNKPIPFFNIETKCQPSTDSVFHPEPEKFVALVMQEIENAKMISKTIIQSFDFRTLQVVHKKGYKVKTAMLIEPDDKRSFEQQIIDLGFTPNIYSPHYSLVNQSLIDACNTKQMLVIPWTVNDLITMKKLKAAGVDGIISDYPNLFKDL